MRGIATAMGTKRCSPRDKEEKAVSHFRPGEIPWTVKDRVGDDFRTPGAILIHLFQVVGVSLCETINKIFLGGRSAAWSPQRRRAV